MSHAINQLNIGQDLFFYSCNEASLARKKKDGSFQSHLRFDPFLVNTFETPENPQKDNFVSYVRQIVAHHSTICPQIRRREQIDIENISYFSQSIATLFADLSTLTQLFCGVDIPPIPHEDMDFSQDYILLDKLVKDYHTYKSTSMDTPFDALDKLSQREKDCLASEWWDIVATAIHSSLEHYVEVVLGYAFWKYQSSQQASAPIDFRVRPPVGEAFARYARETFSNPKRDFNRDNQNTNWVSGAGGHTQNKERPSTKPFEKRDQQQTSHAQTEIYLQEVDKALEQLKKNVSLKEVSLPPANSFVRRNQHSHAVEQGFDSESRGEGKDRHVVVKRK